MYVSICFVLIKLANKSLFQIDKIYRAQAHLCPHIVLPVTFMEQIHQLQHHCVVQQEQDHQLIHYPPKEDLLFVNQRNDVEVQLTYNNMFNNRPSQSCCTIMVMQTQFCQVRTHMDQDWPIHCIMDLVVQLHNHNIYTIQHHSIFLFLLLHLHHLLHHLHHLIIQILIDSMQITIIIIIQINFLIFIVFINSLIIIIVKLLFN